MWSDAGQVKLMDFGIAIAFGSSRVTRMGHMVGTLQYMAPEQVRGRATDARSDLYSLGIVLYHLLAGKLPFRSENDYELMRAQVDREPPPLADHGVAVPPALEAALRRALAKEPSERFADAAEFAAALAPILAELPADPAAHERESGAAHRTANAASPERQTDVVSALPELDAPSPATLSDLPFTELPSLTELGARALPDRPRRHGRWELAGAAAALAVLALSVDLLLFQPTPRAPAAPRLADEAAIDAHARAKVELRSESSATPHAATPLAAEVAREALSQLGWAGPSDPLPNAELTSEPHPRSTAKPRSPRPVQRTEQPRSHKPESQQWIIRR
jgi:serine/threonine protein kinase